MNTFLYNSLPCKLIEKSIKENKNRGRLPLDYNSQ